MRFWPPSLVAVFVLLAGPAAVQPAFAATASPSSEQAAKLAEAQAVIAIMLPPAQRTQMLDDMVSALSASFENAVLTPEMRSDPGLSRILDDMLGQAHERQRQIIRARLLDLMAAMAEAYARTFSLEELRAIHDFARSPAGTRYLTQSLKMMSDPAISAVNGQIAVEAQKASRNLMSEFGPILADYLKNNPEVGERLAAARKAAE